jgi:N-acetylmuramoyl-L-alanine amidase
VIPNARKPQAASRPTATAQNPPPKTPPNKARERWRLDTIVIDAGHGGKDGGAYKHGVREKEVALAVALKLGSYLENELGVKVVYTRKDDRYMTLKERGQQANAAQGKLFISIHANAQRRGGSAYGTNTYILGMHKTTAAREAMERENSVIRLEDNPDEYKEYDETRLIRQVLAQSAYMRQSEALAVMIEKQLAESAKRHSRGVRQAGFYVLWSASMPAVLVEMGFLTNRREAVFLKSELGQTHIASAIYRAVRDFKLQHERELDVAMGSR